MPLAAPDHAEELRDRLMADGRLHGIRPVGSRALDMARSEAPCRIVKRPFFDHPRRRATPPADR